MGWTGGRPAGPSENAASSRAVTLGAISASPSAAAWIAWTSSSGPASLSRKPRAPALRAPCTYSSRSKVVMTTIASGSSTSGPASCRVASMPSMAGMRMSNRHTSGRSSRARATASRPSAASPTTSMSGWASRIIVSPVRTISWSSATSTRMVMWPGPPCGSTALTVQPRSALGPASRVPPSSVARSVMPDQAVAGRVPAGRAGVAVVADGQAHAVVVAGDADARSGSRGGRAAPRW